MITIGVGNGERLLFWVDSWILGRTVGEIAPEVLSLVNTRRRNSRSVAEALRENLWIEDIQVSVSQEAYA
jgi:hypothetical protein